MRNYFLSFLILLFLLFLNSCTTESTPVYELRITVDPIEAGIVSPANGEYDQDTNVEITATANEHWVFDRWLGDHSGSTNPVSIVMNEDKVLTAQFVKREYPLTIETEGEGTVLESLVQSKTTDYPHATIVELSANPSDGWVFTEWIGDITGSDNPTQIEVSGEKSVTAIFNLSESSDPYVRLSIDWESLEAKIESSALKELTNQTTELITHFGARLVYTQDNAVFIQSVERNSQENQGIITLDVPSTSEAFLLAAAVLDEQDKKAVLFGTMDNLNLEQGTEYNWSIENIDWFTPEWIVIDSLVSEYENGVLLADKDAISYQFTIHVEDPFYQFLQRLSQPVQYENNMIKLNGSGSDSYNEDTGNRDFRFVFSNPTPGIANTSLYNDSYPFLDGQQFNLPTGRYVIYEIIETEISWE